MNTYFYNWTAIDDALLPLVLILSLLMVNGIFG